MTTIAHANTAEVKIIHLEVDGSTKVRCNLLAELLRQIRLSPGKASTCWSFSINVDEEGRAVLLGFYGEPGSEAHRIRMPQTIDCGCKTTVDSLSVERGSLT